MKIRNQAFHLLIAIFAMATIVNRLFADQQGQA